MGGPAMMRRLKELKRAERAQDKAGKKEERKKAKANSQATRKVGDEIRTSPASCPAHKNR